MYQRCVYVKVCCCTKPVLPYLANCRCKALACAARCLHINDPLCSGLWLPLSGSDGNKLLQEIHLVLKCGVPHCNHLALQVWQEGCTQEGSGASEAGAQACWSGSSAFNSIESHTAN